MKNKGIYTLIDLWVCPYLKRSYTMLIVIIKCWNSK
jgi:hypothetical protein